MKRTNYYVLSVLAVSFGLASCELDPYEEPATETYTKEFIKTFGLIDSNQDWNMATRGTVTVSTSAPSDVRVYAKNSDGNYSLVADYANVSGEQTLGFDVQRGVSKVLVASGCKSAVVSLGGSVDFEQTSTRAGSYATTSTTQGDVVVESTTDYKYFTKAQVDALTHPDSKTAVLKEGLDNRSKTTNNFSLTAAEGNLTFTMYPIYWNTAHGTTKNGTTYVPDEIGIAYKEGEVIKHVPIFTIKGPNSELKGCTSANGDTYVSVSNYNPTGADYQESTISSQYTYNSTTYTNYFAKFQSQGIKVTVPEGLYYGFYIKANEDATNIAGDYYMYSVAEWNKAMYKTSTLNSDGKVTSESVADGETRHEVYVSTYQDSEGHNFLAFEDWSEDYDDGYVRDHDLNDVVMLVDPMPTVVDEDVTDEWILAGEDLGNIDDFDFNDIVISVAHTAGKEYADITALAAGGTLPLYLYRDGTQIGDEIHAWFGDGSIETSNMINTTSVSEEGKTVRITVPADFSMTSYGDTDKMGGFSFMVTRESGDTQEIKVPENGEAPQIICVPSGWQWPKERVNISTAYPDFGTWGANYQSSEWTKSVVADKVLPTSTSTAE